MTPFEAAIARALLIVDEEDPGIFNEIAINETAIRPIARAIVRVLATDPAWAPLDGLRCVKCGGTDISTRWDARRWDCTWSAQTPPGTASEHLHRHCRTCAYGWGDPIAGAPDGATQELMASFWVYYRCENVGCRTVEPHEHSGTLAAAALRDEGETQ